MYLSVSKTCEVNTNVSDPASFMYVPYHSNYLLVHVFHFDDMGHYRHISCHNIGIFPTVTSPHYLILCSNNVEQLENATYFISSALLGNPIVLKSVVTDYFKKVSQPVQFHLNCVTCSRDIKMSSSELLLVDNSSPVTLTFTGNNMNFNVNVTVTFTSFLLDDYIQPIETQVIVQLVPCFTHLGYICIQ